MSEFKLRRSQEIIVKPMKAGFIGEDSMRSKAEKMLSMDMGKAKKAHPYRESMSSPAHTNMRYS